MSTADASGDMFRVAPEMLDAWVSWDPPWSDLPHRPVQILGAIRAAFYAGWVAAQGIEAATAGETRSGSTEGESPVAEGHAPEPPRHTSNIKGDT